MANLDEYQTIILASLLHDIGKFWQRTGHPHSFDYDLFTKSDYGEHGAHSKWSANFVEQYLPSEWNAVRSPVFYHHNPPDRLSRIICIADWLSSGERQRSDETIWQLQPVFIQITLGEDMPPTGYYYSLEPFKIDDRTIYPSKELLPEQENKIADTLLQPDTVVQSQSDDTVRLFFRLYRGLTIGDKYLCVVVKYLEASIFVITAYFTDRIKKGEVIWRR